MVNSTSYRVNINLIFTENFWEGECKNTVFNFATKHVEVKSLNMFPGKIENSTSMIQNNHMI